MYLNAHTALISPSILLVPYEPHQVPRYHKWMEDAELREATASERLSLPEEYDMQKSWREDRDKLTFLAALPPSSPPTSITAGVEDADDRLVGDVNLFLYEDDDEGDEKDRMGLVGEIELMVALPQQQNKGLGTSIVLLFLWYVLKHREEIAEQKGAGKVLRRLRVKINESNSRSLRLFERLGFKKTSETPNYFEEVEMVTTNLEVGWVEEGMKTRGWREWREVKYQNLQR